MARWNPASWVSLIPNGIGEVKPNHFLEIAKTTWENRDEIPLAWRILTRGVCDGCALGTHGIRDFTMKGVHLCTVRLNLLRLNTMPALDISVLEDIGRLKRLSARDLRKLGRLPYPMIHRKQDRGFKRISWDEAIELVASAIRGLDPHRVAFYLTSRGLTNEVYYVAQKVARFLGTNNIDNSARVCHSPSTVALKQTIGVGASTCSYKDWIGTDLLVLIGSDIPNNQPVTTKYMYYAKQKGTRIAVINPYREPGLERYWVPSIVESALFGTKLADAFFTIHHGGDIAFLNGTLKHLCENNWVDMNFIRDHTTGFEEMRRALASQTWELLQRRSGVSREEMLRFARMIAEARTTVMVWSMGITQHAFGVENVKAIVNLALARGIIGRDYCGLVPIRGHSGVQGGAEVGAVPSALPGGDPITPEAARRFEVLWGFRPPSDRGLTAVEMIDGAYRGEIDMLYSAGGNFVETQPNPEYVESALARVPLRVHQDIVLSPQMFVEAQDNVVLFPAQTRYEQAGGGTETSTERYIYFSPEIRGRRIGESKPEWQIFMELGERVFPDRRSQIHFDDCEAIRKEIAKAVPFYEGIEQLKRKGDAVQYGGRHLCAGGRFPTPDGLGRFSVVYAPGVEAPEGKFLMSTRRGKQFNSMVYADRDPLTGASRDEVLINPDEALRLGLRDGSPVLLRSAAGKLRAHCKLAPIRARNIQVHWPEGNVLIQRGTTEPACGMPDYNAVVEVIPLEEKKDDPEAGV